MNKKKILYSTVIFLTLAVGTLSPLVNAADPDVTYLKHTDVAENDTPLVVASKGIMFTEKDSDDRTGRASTRFLGVVRHH